MSEAETLLAEIGRLYIALQALPHKERPETRGIRRDASPTYLALEAEIRDRAARYMAIDPQCVLIAPPI